MRLSRYLELGWKWSTIEDKDQTGRNKAHRVTPLLVCVICRAGRNLHLRPISTAALWNFQALVAEHFNYASAKGPLLRGRSGAWLDGDSGSVDVGSSGQAFRCVSRMS